MLLINRMRIIYLQFKVQIHCLGFLKNRTSYNDALAILKRIDSSSCGENSDIPAPEAAEFTLHIKNSIDMITDTEALIEYITEHKYWFNSWNISSNKVISGLMNDLVHESE